MNNVYLITGVLWVRNVEGAQMKQQWRRPSTFEDAVDELKEKESFGRGENGEF